MADWLDQNSQVVIPRQSTGNWLEDNSSSVASPGANLKQEAPGIWNSDMVKNLTFRGDKDSLERSRSGFQRSVISGVPIVGQIAKKIEPENQYQQQYEQEHPGRDLAGKLTGAALATVPLSNAVTKAMQGSTVADMAGQFLLGGGLTAADKFAQKGTNFNEDDAKNSLMSGLFASAGPLAGRMLSPNLPAVRPDLNTPLNPTVSLAQIAKNRGGNIGGAPSLSELTRKAPEVKQLHPVIQSLLRNTHESISDAALAAMAGHYMFGAAVPFGMVGAAAPFVKDLISRYGPNIASNSLAHSPMNQAVLNMIARQAGDTVADQ